MEDVDRVAASLHCHGMSMDRLSHGRNVAAHLSGVDVVLFELGLPDIRAGRP